MGIFTAVVLQVPSFLLVAAQKYPATTITTTTTMLTTFSATA